MKLHITWRNITAFVLLALLLGELHEQAHFIVGRLICGCWPESRDFNAWSICQACKDTNPYWYWPTFAGPVVSMCLAWVGMYMLRDVDFRKQSLGFLLIWGNVPQARVMTVLMHGGDERLVIRNLARGTALEDYFEIISILVVLIMALPPIVASFMTVKNRLGWLYNIGFMIVPLLVMGTYGFFLLNWLLLEKHFLQEPWLMGTPLFITLHTTLVFSILMLWFRKDLFTIATADAKVN